MTIRKEGDEIISAKIDTVKSKFPSRVKSSYNGGDYCGDTAEFFGEGRFKLTEEEYEWVYEVAAGLTE